jgi:hypothetical protein
MNYSKSTNLMPRRGASTVTALVAAIIGLITPAINAALQPNHGIVAANIDVTINDFFNNTNSVFFEMPVKVGDFRLAQEGSNNGDYDTQIGNNPTNNVTDGIMMSSVRQNGRDDNWIIHPGTNYSVSLMDWHRPGAAREGAYWIPVAMATNPTAVVEYDVNVAAAWFPYSKWIGGVAYNGANGQALTNFIGSPQLVLGTHFKDLSGGKSIVDLTGLSIDSRTDGTLIVVGAKNENNWAAAGVNATNGTWNLLLHDVANNTSGTEQDPIGFVYIPKTNTTVISGRFNGKAQILTYSGATPQFTVTSNSVGTWTLKLLGKDPRFGVLIVSPEAGSANNQDNYVSYEMTPAKDGWVIQARDFPPLPANTFPQVPALETPDSGNSAICGFVFIPGPTPGFAVSGTNSLVTAEDGQQATFTVNLLTKPAADVTINLSSTVTAEGTVSPSSLTFNPTNWAAPQTVTITGVDDALVDGPQPYTIVISAATSTDPEYNGIDPDDVSVVNADDESGAFVLSNTSGLVTTEAGGQATFAVHLTTAPTADVTLPISSSNPNEGSVSPSSLTFNASNYNQDQIVTITGVNDFVVDGNVQYTIITGPSTSADPNYNGLNPADPSVLNMDNDTAGLIIPGANVGFQVAEGKTNTYTIALQSQPTDDVTISLASSDTVQGGSVSPTNLTFTAADWNIPQTVSFIGANDLVLDGSTAWRITNSVTSPDPIYAALGSSFILITTLDDEATVTLPSGDLRYGIGQGGVGIDGRATITDSNTLSYSGATITVTITTNGTAADRLEIRNTGTDTNQVGVSGSNVTYGGTNIATFTGGTGTTPLAITFNAASTPAIAQAVLQSVTYRNTNSSPSLNRRSVSVSLVRGDTYAVSASTGVRLGYVRIADFQQNADHGYGAYADANDLELFQSQPNTALPHGHSGDPNNPQMWIDYRDPDSPNQSEVLLRFDNIVGNGLGQIPSNAIIVSAELYFNVRDAGDGSPLYRMLIPWDATNDTWNSMGNGIDVDGIEAATNYNALLGVPPVNGDSGIGVISVGCTIDVQAWVNGTNNYGWAMPSWNSTIDPTFGNGTDGLGFHCCESPNIDNRPRLKVLWLPPASASTASFRQNVNGYTSAADTRIRMTAPDTSATTATAVLVDWDVAGGGTNNPDQVLVKFDNIIGAAAGQIPAGAQIKAAVLDLATVSGNGYGDGGQFFAMLTPWQDTATWNSLGGGIQPDGVKAATNATASTGSPTFDPNACGGYENFEVTPDVQAWLSGTRANYGWAILPWDGGGDGWAVSMSESAKAQERPQLRVYYTPPITIASITRGPTSATLQLTGDPTTTYYIQRATSVTGAYGTIGNATTAGDGTVSFTDNSPPAGAAFYRLSTTP